MQTAYTNMYTVIILATDAMNECEYSYIVQVGESDCIAIIFVHVCVQHILSSHAVLLVCGQSLLQLSVPATSMGSISVLVFQSLIVPHNCQLQ